MVLEDVGAAAWEGESLEEEVGLSDGLFVDPSFADFVASLGSLSLLLDEVVAESGPAIVETTEGTSRQCGR